MRYFLEKLNVAKKLSEATMRQPATCNHCPQRQQFCRGVFLLTTTKTYIDGILGLSELGKKMMKNIQERDLLKQLIKLAEQRDRLRSTEGIADG